MSNGLKEHLKDQVTEEQVDRVWLEMKERIPESAGQPNSFFGGRRFAEFFAPAGALGVVLCLAGAAIFFSSHGENAGALEENSRTASSSRDGLAPQGLNSAIAPGADVRTSVRGLSLELSEGSSVDLAPHSHVSMLETGSKDVTLALSAGSVSCDVAKNRGRTFSVVAGSVVVRVVGTEFSVTRSQEGEDELVQVVVRQGVVEVSAPETGVKRLTRGESWSVRVPRSEPLSQKAQEEELEAKAVAAGESSERAKVRRDRNLAAKSGSSESGSPESGSPESGSSESGSPESGGTKPSVEDSSQQARRLFEKARQARSSGRPQEAAMLFSEFLQKYGSDGRVGIASLELGRLRMDQLGDVRGALAPLSRAASMGGGLSDDALSRLAQAHARLGQVAACRSARERYLKAYPNGVHVVQVRGLCGGAREAKE